MRDRVRIVVAATSTALLVTAWAVALGVRTGDPAYAHAGQLADVEVPAVHIDGLATPQASPVDAPAAEPRASTTAVQSISASARGAEQLPPSAIPSTALSAYQRAAAVLGEAKSSCRLPWSLLAAIGKVESDHGRYGGNQLDDKGRARPGIYGVALTGKNDTARITDSDGGEWDRDTTWDRAVGPMQFIPTTWEAVAVDADDDSRRDPQDIDDAALAAGVYLCAGGNDLGSDRGARAAVLSYNHSTTYASTVLALARAYERGETEALALPATKPAPDGSSPGGLQSTGPTNDDDKSKKQQSGTDDGPAQNRDSDRRNKAERDDGNKQRAGGSGKDRGKQVDQGKRGDREGSDQRGETDNGEPKADGPDGPPRGDLNGGDNKSDGQDDDNGQKNQNDQGGQDDQSDTGDNDTEGDAPKGDDPKAADACAVLEGGAITGLTVDGAEVEEYEVPETEDVLAVGDPVPDPGSLPIPQCAGG